MQTTDLGGEREYIFGILYDFDVIILDLTLPDISGHDVLRRLRLNKVSTPILVLSALTEIADKVKSFSFGADDYLTKPFHKDELIARLHAIIRRSKGHGQTIIRTGDLTLNIDEKNAQIQGERLNLTKKEYQVLELLSLRQGRTLTKEQFLSHLYQGGEEPVHKILDVFICKLRRKLANASGGKNYIETVWGHGYALRDPNANATLISGAM